MCISKGYMEWDDFEAAVKSLKLDKVAPVVFHFRIATHGRISPGNCHPFPLTKKVRNLEVLDCVTDLGIVHNGVLDIEIPTKSLLSDTQVFVKDVLADSPPEVIRHPVYQKTLALTGSKFAFLTTEELYLVGEFIYEDGWDFSNYSYEPLTTQWYQYVSGKCELCPNVATCVDDEYGWKLCAACGEDYGRLLCRPIQRELPVKVVKTEGLAQF